jgi:cell division transport system ATP-binding protein
MIVLDHVSKTYQGNQGSIQALKDVCLSIDKGEFVFIVGLSGSGKTTLFRLLLKELEPTSGNIFINNKNIGKLHRSQIPKFRRGIGVVFQDFKLLKNRTVYENIAFAQRIIGVPGRRIKRNVNEVLKLVNLQGKEKAKPSELSGGEQQRVALARALINNPPVLLADEPTGNLDSENSKEIIALLRKFNKENNQTVIIITHDERIALSADRVITIEDGKIIRDSKKEGVMVS